MSVLVDGIEESDYGTAVSLTVEVSSGHPIDIQVWTDWSTRGHEVKYRIRSRKVKESVEGFFSDEVRA